VRLAIKTLIAFVVDFPRPEAEAEASTNQQAAP
jgi:hypothetical protein